MSRSLYNKIFESDSESDDVLDFQFTRSQKGTQTFRQDAPTRIADSDIMIGNWGTPEGQLKYNEYFATLVDEAIRSMGLNADLNFLSNQAHGCTDFSGMFADMNFNGDISQWDMSRAINISSMFYNNHAIDQDLSEWDLSNVRDMSEIFSYSKTTTTNLGLSNWDVSNCVDFSGIFAYTSLNEDVSNWDVSSGKYFVSTFAMNPAFNQDLSNWDISAGEDFRYMFAASNFSNDLSSWNMYNANKIEAMFEDCPIKEEFKPEALQQK